MVREMARKFPEMSGSPCGVHFDLIANDLLGYRVSLHTQIPRPGGRRVRSGMIFEQTPEEEAFSRWQKGQFHDVERLAAATWRKALSELDLTAMPLGDSRKPWESSWSSPGGFWAPSK
jgi:hypothetical protein